MEYSESTNEHLNNNSEDFLDMEMQLSHLHADTEVCNLKSGVAKKPQAWKYEYFWEEGNYKIKYIFNENITNMTRMFCSCYALTNINLSNFNTQNVTNLRYIFYGCEALKKENIITKDNKILNYFN